MTALQLALSWQANRTAADDTDQLIRVQGIKTTLLRADALATNAFLIGGLEPAERAGGLRRRDRPDRPRDHRRCRRPACRPGCPRRPERRRPRLHRRHGAGPREQPPGFLSAGPTSARPVASCARRLCRSSTSSWAPTPHVLATRWAATTPSWSCCRRSLRSSCSGWPTGGSGARFRRRVNTGLFLAIAAIGLVGVLAAIVTNGQQNQNDELTDGLLQSVVEGSAAHGRQRRQGQREPAPHRARVRAGLRGRVDGRGATVDLALGRPA